MDNFKVKKYFLDNYRVGFLVTLTPVIAFQCLALCAMSNVTPDNGTDYTVES